MSPYDAYATVNILAKTSYFFPIPICLFCLFLPCFMVQTIENRIFLPCFPDFAYFFPIPGGGGGYWPKYLPLYNQTHH